MNKKIIWAYNAIKRYLFKDTKYLFLYTYRYFQNNYHNNCKFYTDEELANLIKAGKSTIRLGDGETSLLHFLPPPNNAQKYSDSIRNDFLKIVKNYNNDSKYIIGTLSFVNYTNTELKKINRFRHFGQSKITYELIYNKNAKYFDAHAFYKDSNFEKIIVPYIKTKKVIIVANKKLQEKIINSKLSSSTYLYVTCEDKNAYESRLKIQNDIINLIEKTGLPKNNFVILMCAGFSKTIIYDMSIKGYQMLDIGNGLRSYYMETNIEHLILNISCENGYYY